MFVVWTLFGALVGWAVLGALIGIVAALTRKFSVAAGIIGGSLLGPLAFLMFRSNDVAKTDVNLAVPLRERIIDYGRRPYARRRCPECTGPNDYLVWHGATAEVKGDCGDFVPAARLLFTHRYRCVLCGYEWQFESPVGDPDKPPYECISDSAPFAAISSASAPWTCPYGIDTIKHGVADSTAVARPVELSQDAAVCRSHLRPSVIAQLGPGRH